MDLKIGFFTDSNAEDWDDFISECPSATFLHTRRFLSYHQNRFTDRSIIVTNRGQLVAVLPAALSHIDKLSIVSHPGLTYGGLQFIEKLGGEDLLEVMRQACDFYRKNGYRSLIYKAVPWFYHERPTQLDIYAIWRLGGEVYQENLSNVINLRCRGAVGSRRKRAKKRAIKSQLKIRSGGDCLTPFWGLLTQNLKDKYSVSPTHSLEEIMLLKSMFPDAIDCVVAEHNGEAVAGVVYFETANTTHCQYIGSNGRGRNLGAVDLVLEFLIEESERRGNSWFDFASALISCI